MIMSSFYIYKITNKINGKIYVGKSKNPQSRYKRHLYIADKQVKKNNQFQPIHAAISKYGSENFSLDIIDECDSEIEIFTKEIYWIEHCKSNLTKYPNFGYNLTNGGEGVAGLSPSLETRNKISEANSGENNGMAGKTHTIETRYNMSVSQASRKIREPITEEHKQKLKEATDKQDFSFRIPIEIKKEIVKLYSAGQYTKRQLADKFALKYNSVVKILRTNKQT